MDAKVEAKERKKRSWSEMECAEVDLELRLSVAGSTSSDNLLNAIESATSGTPLSLSYQRACLASKMAIDKNLDDTPKDERPPLIAMGCAICLVYVMVSKAHPKYVTLTTFSIAKLVCKVLLIIVSTLSKE
ncbi:uncharacterized protein HKW66_Vig0197980 [Vigna angularis]|uniref:Uncharacterized protein n=1 Tax=Phaseolus angularis TaxID=3914 RepID=A0A8T0KN98_PHAAN|nr:uncharacterized protein HKW66_Vig0197980 [Vigna angularis]